MCCEESTIGIFYNSSNLKFNVNKIENRVKSTEYASNKPIEDRYFYTNLKEVDGYLATVLDGHAGWQLCK